MLGRGGKGANSSTKGYNDMCMPLTAGHESTDTILQAEAEQPICIRCLQEHRAILAGLHVSGPWAAGEVSGVCKALRNG